MKLGIFASYLRLIEDDDLSTFDCKITLGQDLFENIAKIRAFEIESRAIGTKLQIWAVTSCQNWVLRSRNKYSSCDDSCVADLGGADFDLFAL